jgi:disulfide bond formation protein DsbB
MYPQSILFGMALWKNDGTVRRYAITFSVIGALISGYHYLLQRGVSSSISCGAVGYSVSCAQVFVMNYGYITIPLMAFTAFGLILLLQLRSLIQR